MPPDRPSKVFSDAIKRMQDSYESQKLLKRIENLESNVEEIDRKLSRIMDLLESSLGEN